MNTPRTPREILLARHDDHVRPALDAQRDALLARFAATTTAAPTSSAPLTLLTALRAAIGLLHRELVAPCRHAWAALACVWLAILVFQQVDRLSTPALSFSSLAGHAPAADTTLLALWMEHRRQLAALADDTAFHAAPLPVREKISAPAASRPLGAVEVSHVPLTIA